MKFMHNTRAYVRVIPDNVDENRTIDFIISDDQKDRHNTVLNMDNWKLDNYAMNPVVGYNHTFGAGLFRSGSPDNVIGTSRVRVEDNKLVASATFEPPEINKMADKIFNKLKFGSLRAASVGFIEIGKGKYGKGDEARGGKNETYYFDGQELLEWSVVDIPSNPGAGKRDNFTFTVQMLLDKIAKHEKEFDLSEVRKMELMDYLAHIEGIADHSKLFKALSKGTPNLDRALKILGK